MWNLIRLGVWLGLLGVLVLATPTEVTQAIPQAQTFNMHHSYGTRRDACPQPAQFTPGSTVASYLTGAYAVGGADVFVMWYWTNEFGDYLGDIGTYRYTFQANESIGFWYRFSPWDVGLVAVEMYEWNSFEGWRFLGASSYYIGIAPSFAPNAGACPGGNTSNPNVGDGPRPSGPAYVIEIGSNHGYEPWGRPLGGGCQEPYNDGDPVQRFTVEIILTNQSNRTINEDWAWPEFYTFYEANPITCNWYHPYQAVPPGGSTNVTFATHLEQGDRVTRMVFTILGERHTICLNADGSKATTCMF